MKEIKSIAEFRKEKSVSIFLFFYCSLLTSYLRLPTSLMVIFLILQNSTRPVNLFGQYEAHQLMGKDQL